MKPSPKLAPLECSHLNELMAAIRMGQCTGQSSAYSLQACLEACIGKLGPIDIGDLFDQLHNEISHGVEGGLEASRRHRYRKVLGVRYGSLLLGSVLPFRESKDANEESIRAAMRAAVEESLQWHEHSVLSHVLVYFNDGRGNEELLHHCAIVGDQNDQHYKDAMDNFSRALADYVDKDGSSVRTQAHLKLVALDSSSGRTDPPVVPKPLLWSPRELHLPTDTKKYGEQQGYRDAVRTVSSTCGPFKMILLMFTSQLEVKRSPKGARVFEQLRTCTSFLAISATFGRIISTRCGKSSLVSLSRAR